MKKVIVLTFVLLASLISNSQTPLTDANIHEAVDLWVSDQPTAEATYGHISNWSTTNITNMSGLFFGKTSFNDNIGNWDVSSVTDMSNMFTNSSFNQPIGNWDVSSVTNMYHMFIGSDFNQPIGNWDVSNVTDMSGMFNGANGNDGSPFNQSIGDWDVSSVTDMSFMFFASNFNQPIGDWDVSNVVDMHRMFLGSAFNQPIGNWDVSSVTNMSYMFGTIYNETSPFDQPIGAWDVSSVTDMSGMFNGAIFFSTENYDNLLIGWATQTLQTNVILDAALTPYCNGETARNHIISTYNWTINDADKDCSTLSDPYYLSNTFSFYPNPTTSTIQLNSLFNSSYTLYSSLGQAMSKGDLKVGDNSIDLSPYDNGVYFLHIKIDKGTTIKRIIKH